jgi:hypothetical protein
MLFDEYTSLTLTQYLGCLHAFVRQFQDELSTIRKFATQMSGQSRSIAFGWAASLDQARYNGPLVVDRWRHFNMSAQDRLEMTPDESELYGTIPSIHHALETCNDLDDMLERTNRFMDTLETFASDEVRIIHEMMDALAQEIVEDRTYISVIAERFEAQAGEIALTPDESTGLIMIGEGSEKSEYGETFAQARETFMSHLKEG